MTQAKSRRSGRITKQIPIILLGSDVEGRVFAEETVTVVLSLHGAGIQSTHKLVSEQEMSIRSRVTHREAEVRVVGEIAEQGQLHIYGVAFVDDSLDFWQENFPPPPANSAANPLLTLECISCHSAVTLKNGDFEADVCAIHGGLVRYCDQCGFSTIWKPSLEILWPGGSPKSPPALQQKPKPAIVSATLLKPAPTKQPQSQLAAVAVLDTPSTSKIDPLPGRLDLTSDQRLHVRAKINYFACIRSEAFGDEIAPCIDMSRGGLCFRSRHAHQVSLEIRVAVPFSPDAPVATALFVTARVVSVAEIPGLNRYRCSVAFLPRT